MEIIRGKQQKPLKAVVYGPEGVGKSSLAASFPAPLFVDVEGGTARLDVARTSRPESWAEFKQIVSALAKEPQGFQTLVIDTADWLERLAIREVCAKHGATSLGGNSDYGKSYNELAELWGSILTQLEADLIDTGEMHVVFLAHSATKKFELPEEEGQFDRYQLSLEKKSSPMLKEWCDMLLFCNYKTIVNVDDKTGKAKGTGGTRRVMYAERTAAYDAKNRDGLPREMDLGFAPLAHCFCPIGAPAPVVAPASAPTPPQTAAPVAPENAPGVSQQQRALAKLMTESGVTWEQLIAVIAARGYFPIDTEMTALPDDFIAGKLFPAWGKITNAIAKNAAA